jgi:hypothetical protein
MSARTLVAHADGLYLDDRPEGFGLSAEDSAVLYRHMAGDVGQGRPEFLG